MLRFPIAMRAIEWRGWTTGGNIYVDPRQVATVRDVDTITGGVAEIELNTGSKYLVFESAASINSKVEASRAEKLVPE